MPVTRISKHVKMPAIPLNTVVRVQFEIDHSTAAVMVIHHFFQTFGLFVVRLICEHSVRYTNIA